MEDVLLYWYEIIDRDLRGFADLRTPVAVEVSNRTLTANWTARGRARHAQFRLSSEGDFRWLRQDDERDALPYRQFLLSEEMADFTQLSAAIANAFLPEPHYVATKATTEASTDEHVSDDLVLTEVARTLENTVGKTRLLFVKGDAGSGKSTLLRQLTGQRARSYQEGQSAFLFMYVSAQGRALSNLRDAISGELDDLRAGFTRDAVPALVRQGLLVPIVDGFDELLGAAGYGDAFSSLQQFLAEIDGEGMMIVSARSAFYDVEFVGRRTPEELTGAKYDVEPFTLSPWREEDLHAYLALARGDDTVDERDRDALASLDPSDRELLSKPFFASLFPGYVDSRARNSEERSLLDYLVNAYVKRESGKIVDRNGHPLLPIEVHKQLLLEATELMWGYESRDLSADDLRTLAELVAESSKLPSDTAHQFVTKITSYHGFQTARNGAQRRFRFEHEIYFDYFLSRALRERLGHPDAMTTFLDSGLIPNEVVRATVDAKNASSCLLLQAQLKRQGVLQENRRRNLGSLTAAAIGASGGISDLTLSNLLFVNVSFGEATIRNVRFDNCVFSNVGLEQVRLEDCEAEGSLVDRLAVSEATRLAVAGLTPGVNLRCLYNVSDGRELYVPSEMADLMRSLGAPGLEPPPPRYSRIGEAVVSLLHRVVQKFRRTNILCIEDDLLVRLFQDPSWPTLRMLLRQSEVVEEQSRQTSGTKKTFLRPQVDMVDLLRHEHTPDPELPRDSVGHFWQSVRHL